MIPAPSPRFRRARTRSGRGAGGSHNAYPTVNPRRPATPAPTREEDSVKREKGRSAWERIAAKLLHLAASIVGPKGRIVKLAPVRCRGCHHVIEAARSWVNFPPRDGRDDGEPWLWHWGCLYRARGGTLVAPEPIDETPAKRLVSAAPTGVALN